MITVTGASGQLGHLVIDALLAHVPATDITAAVRSPEKAADLAAKGVRVVKADYNAPETLVSAFAGTDRLLIISGNEFGQRVEQYERIVAAAKAAGVTFIGYTSIINGDGNPMFLGADHKVAERLVSATGIAHAFLRNSWYNENYVTAIQSGAAHGVVSGAAGTGRISAASRADYAEAAAVVMAEGRPGVFELGGSQAFTMADLAAMIGKASGKAVTFNNLSPDDYAAQLKGFGVPEGMAAALADSDRYAADGWLFTESKDLETLIGHKTTPMAETIKAVLSGA
jgi:NAD(P)H dehydrogenase (quinone)